MTLVYLNNQNDHIQNNHSKKSALHCVPQKRARFNLLSLGSNLTNLQNSFTVRKSMKPKTKPYQTVHHTFSMLLHYLGKLESKFGENYTVLLKTCSNSVRNLNRFSHSFSADKKKENYKRNYNKLGKTSSEVA